jgi:hypothetical protein
MDDKEIAALLGRLPTRRQDRSWGCLSEAELAAYADGRLEGRARQRVEGHLADCGYCLEQIGFLLRSREGGASEPVPGHLEAQALELGRGKGLPMPGHRWGAVAAAAAAAAVVLVLRTPSPEAPPVPSAPTVVPTSRAPAAPAPAPAPAPEPPEVVRSRPVGPLRPEPILPRPDSLVPRGSLEFRWRAVPRSLFYDVRLATAEGDLVWEGRATATSLCPPVDLPLAEGQKYFVWVRAHMPEGKTVQSRALAFSVKDGS